MVVLGKDFGVGGVGKAVVFRELVSDLLELGGERGFSIAKEADYAVLKVVEELGGLLDGGEQLGGGSSLGAHVLDDAVSLEWSVVVRGHLAVLEYLQSRKAFDAIFTADLCLGSTVDLDQRHGWIVALESSRSYFVFWGET